MSDISDSIENVDASDMNAGNDMFVFGDVQGNPHASGS